MSEKSAKVIKKLAPFVTAEVFKPTMGNSCRYTIDLDKPPLEAKLKPMVRQTYLGMSCVPEDTLGSLIERLIKYADLRPKDLVVFRTIRQEVITVAIGDPTQNWTVLEDKDEV